MHPLSCQHPSALQKRHLEKSDGELPNSFEQRVHIMLHRMGVTKGLVTESKKQQVRLDLLVGRACTHMGGGGGGPMGQMTQSSAVTARSHLSHHLAPTAGTTSWAPVHCVGLCIPAIPSSCHHFSFSLQSKDSEIKKAGSDGEGPSSIPGGHPENPHTRALGWLWGDELHTLKPLACICRGHRGQLCGLPTIPEGSHTLCVHRYVGQQRERAR